MSRVSDTFKKEKLICENPPEIENRIMDDSKSAEGSSYASDNTSESHSDDNSNDFNISRKRKKHSKDKLSPDCKMVC
jgi:hypothetical protein